MNVVNLRQAEQHLKGIKLKTRLAVFVTSIAVTLGALFVSPAWASTSLTGAGSSYANKFFVQCDANTSNFSVTYNPAGSGAGRTQFANGTVDFGASDAPNAITLSGSRAGGKYTYVPIVGGPIAMIYNIPGIANGDLRLDAPTIAKIFKGNITRWNDSQIVNLQSDNIRNLLPNQAIQVVYRGSSSGTTENLTDYMKQTAGTIWTTAKNGLLYTGSVTAPAGAVSATNAQDMVAKVDAVSFRFGYADLADSMGTVKRAKVKNAVGEWIAPSSASAALFLKENYGNINTTTGAVTLKFTKKVKNAYNLSLIAYMLVDKGVAANKVLPSGATAANVKDWALYLLNTCGPNSASGLGYSPISGSLLTAAQLLANSIVK